MNASGINAISNQDKERKDHDYNNKAMMQNKEIHENGTFDDSIDSWTCSRQPRFLHCDFK